MKTTILPKQLLNLPQPWGQTHPEQRGEGIDLLSYETNSIKTALNVLERCLHTLSELTFSLSEHIPEELYELWASSAQWLALSIPTFDDFDLEKVEKFLINDEGIDSPSPELIRDVGEYWLWWVTWEIERVTLNWVEDALMKTRDSSLISDFLYMVELYWQRLEPDFASSVLGASAMVGWQKALPLFESVEQHPNASEEVIETVRDYRELILKNRHKWLPESNGFSELPTSENESNDLSEPTLVPEPVEGRQATEPALAGLLYVYQ